MISPTRGQASLGEVTTIKAAGAEPDAMFIPPQYFDTETDAPAGRQEAVPWSNTDEYYQEGSIAQFRERNVVMFTELTAGETVLLPEEEREQRGKGIFSILVSG